MSPLGRLGDGPQVETVSLTESRYLRPRESDRSETENSGGRGGVVSNFIFDLKPLLSLLCAL